MILIAYDGTSDANHAIAVAGALLRGGQAHIVHVWEPLATLAERFAVAGTAALPGVALDEEIRREEAGARGVADAGVELARAAGFDADGEAVHGEGFPAQTLEREVARLRPDLVLIGSRGLSALTAFIEGSVSRHVSTHAQTPVLIVPPAPGD